MLIQPSELHWKKAFFLAKLCLWCAYFFRQKPSCAMCLIFSKKSLRVLNWPCAYKKMSVIIMDHKSYWNSISWLTVESYCLLNVSQEHPFSIDLYRVFVTKLQKVKMVGFFLCKLSYRGPVNEIITKVILLSTWDGVFKAFLWGF